MTDRWLKAVCWVLPSRVPLSMTILRPYPDTGPVELTFPSLVATTAVPQGAPKSTPVCSRQSPRMGCRR